METPVLRNIVGQHAEEAAFLWFLRDAAVRGPHYVLDGLAELDDRVDAHLDGLLIAGETGWDLCREALETGEAGELFAASYLAFESGLEDRIQVVLENGDGDRGVSRGITSALGWLSFEQVEDRIRRLLADDSPDLRRIGLAACVAHRRDPGKHLNQALVNPDPSLVACALEAIGQLGRNDLLPYVMDYRDSEDGLCRFSAAWSGAMLGDAASVDTLRECAGTDVPWEEDAVMAALCRMALPAALDWQKELAQKADTVRLSVIGAGVIGDPTLVPWLIARMSIPELARLAGEAFAMITGARITSGDLEGKPSEGFAAGPTESPEDEDVASDPDEGLSWPNPETVPGWWGENRGRFRTGIPYLEGKPVTAEILQLVLRTGRQRGRRAAAVKLAMMSPGQPLFEVRAPGFRQKQLLGLR